MSERRDEVKRFHELEQEGLRRADERDSKSKSDQSWFLKVQDAANEEMKPFYANLGERDWSDFAGYLSSAAYAAAKDAKSCEYADERRADCPVTYDTWYYLTQMDQRYGGLRDRPPPATSRCTHLVAAKTQQTYKLNHALNDVTACLHRSIEHYETAARTWHKEGKCMWRE